MAITVKTSLVVQDGKEILIDSMANNTLPNLLKFRVGNLATRDALETDTDLQAGAGYLVEKDITDKTKLAYNQLRFRCILDPADGNLTNLNELGIFYYDSTTTTYKLFIYCTFPEVDKNDTVGLEFNIDLMI